MDIIHGQISLKSVKNLLNELIFFIEFYYLSIELILSLNKKPKLLG